MSQPNAPHDAIGSLERLYAKNVITLEEGQVAARLIMKDDAYAFPPPARAPPTPEPGPQPAPAPTQAETPPAEPSGNGDGTSPS